MTRHRSLRPAALAILVLSMPDPARPGCDVLGLAAGSRHGLALRSDGSVWSWGQNDWGQLGDDSLADWSVPVQVVDVPPVFLGEVVAVAAGGWHSVAITTDGLIHAWGSNAFGQLGQYVALPALPLALSSRPLVVNDSTGVIPGGSAVAAGGHHSLVLLGDGTVIAWGANESGQLGDGTASSSDTPVTVIGLDRVVAVAAGHAHSLALRSDGTVWSWGYNGHGQLARSTAPASHSASPGAVTGFDDVRAIAAGANHSLALRADGSVWAWGWNEDGQLGDGSFVNRSSPVQVVGPAAGFLADIKGIGGGARHSLALRADGTLWAWGYNDRGQLGAPTLAERQSTPVQVLEANGQPALEDNAALAGGAFHSLAFRAGDAIRSFGLDDRGQLGNTAVTATDFDTTDAVTAELACDDCVLIFAAVAGGELHSVALKGDGLVVTWGEDGLGQLGDGQAGADSAHPVYVDATTGLEVAIAVAAGRQHSLALAPDGTVWAWGDNASGQLGDGTSAGSPLPVQVLDEATGLPLENVVAVDAGRAHSLALKANGEVWAWGDNTYGQLAQPPGGSSPYPSEVDDLPLAYRIAAGGDHCLAVTTGGLWAWGRNNRGQLGLDPAIQIDSGDPVLVQFPFGSAARVTRAAGGREHSLARRDDGTVWAWGSNQYGQLGNDSSTDSFTPVQASFPAGVRMVAVAAGDWHSLAARRDIDEGGTAWAWGRNSAYQLGDGTNVQRLTPVEVSALAAVSEIDAGSEHSLAREGDGLLWSWGANGSGQLGDGSTAAASVPAESVRDDAAPLIGNVVRGVKVGDAPDQDVHLTFNGAPPAWMRWRVLLWEMDKAMSVPPIGPYDESPVLTSTSYTDDDAVPGPPTMPLGYYLHSYQARGVSRLCSLMGP